MDNWTIRQGARQTPAIKLISNHVEKVFATQLNPHRRVRILGQNTDLRTVSVTNYGLCGAPEGTETPILIPYLSVYSLDEYGFANEGGPQPGQDALVTDTTPGNPLIYGQPDLSQTNPYMTSVVSGSGVGLSQYGTYPFGVVIPLGHASKVKKKPKLQILAGEGIKFGTSSNGIDPPGGAPTDANSDPKYLTVDLATFGALKINDTNGLEVLVDGTSVDVNHAGQLEAILPTTYTTGRAEYIAGNGIALENESVPLPNGSMQEDTAIYVEVASVAGQPQSGLCLDAVDPSSTGGSTMEASAASGLHGALRINLWHAAGGTSAGGTGGTVVGRFPWYMPSQYRPVYSQGVQARLDGDRAENNPHDLSTYRAWWHVGWKMATTAQVETLEEIVPVVGLGGSSAGDSSGGSSAGDSSGSSAGGGAQTTQDVPCVGGPRGGGLRIDAGNGNQLALYLAANSALAFAGTDGEQLVTTVDEGVKLDSLGLSLKLCTLSGLQVDACGLSANVDGVTMFIHPEGLHAISGGYASGPGILISGETISASPDMTTVGFNSRGELQTIDNDLEYCLQNILPPGGNILHGPCFFPTSSGGTVGERSSDSRLVPSWTPDFLNPLSYADWRDKHNFLHEDRPLYDKVVGIPLECPFPLNATVRYGVQYKINGLWSEPYGWGAGDFFIATTPVPDDNFGYYTNTVTPVLFQSAIDWSWRGVITKIRLVRTVAGAADPALWHTYSFRDFWHLPWLAVKEYDPIFFPLFFGPTWNVFNWAGYEDFSTLLFSPYHQEWCDTMYVDTQPDSSLSSVTWAWTFAPDDAGNPPTNSPCHLPYTDPWLPPDASTCNALKLDYTALRYNESGQLAVVAPDDDSAGPALTSISASFPLKVTATGSSYDLAIDTSTSGTNDYIGWDGTEFIWFDPVYNLEGGLGVNVSHNTDGTDTVTWYDPTNLLLNPMHAPGDLVIGGPPISAVRLPVGASDQVLTVGADGHLVWKGDDDTTDGGGLLPPDTSDVNHINGLFTTVDINGAGTVTVTTDTGTSTVTVSQDSFSGTLGVNHLSTDLVTLDAGDIALQTALDGHLVITRHPSSGTDPTIYRFDVPHIGYVSGDLDVTGSLVINGDLDMGDVPFSLSSFRLSLVSGSGLGIGSYAYVYTYTTTSGGETTESDPFYITTVSGDQAVRINLGGVSIPGINGRNIYRTLVDTPGIFDFLTHITGTANSIYIDTAPDSALPIGHHPPTSGTASIGTISGVTINTKDISSSQIGLNHHALRVGGGGGRGPLELLLDGVPIGGGDFDSGTGGPNFVAFDVSPPDSDISPIDVLYQRADGERYTVLMYPITTGGSGPGDFVPGEYVPGG